MNTNFVPKDFDRDVRAPYCSDRQFGTGQTTPHWHSGAEIIFMVKGTADVLFNNSWHRLTENALLFIPRGQLHCCRCSDPNAEKLVMGFTEACFEKEGIGLSLPAEINEHCVLYGLENTPLPALFHAFEAHCNGKERYTEHLLAKAALFQLYAYLLTVWEKRGISIRDKGRDSVGAAIYAYIDSHFAEDISPYTAAAELHMSYSSLSRKIQELENESFIKYVNRIRIEHAKRLLAVTDKSVTEISLECGFTSTSYFIKLFRELTDMTPKFYRGLVTD